MSGGWVAKRSAHARWGSLAAGGGASASGAESDAAAIDGAGRLTPGSTGRGGGCSGGSADATVHATDAAVTAAAAPFHLGRRPVRRGRALAATA